MTDYIERFILAKKAENASPNTIRAYRADLIDLSNFIGSKQGPDRLTRNVVRAFLALSSERGQQKSTMKRKLYAIKSFARWLIGERIISDDDFTKIGDLRSPKLPSVLPDVPSQEEMLILLDGGDFPTAFPSRDRLLLELMYGTGLRVSEVAQIRVDDLRLEQSAILIHGKGGPYGKNAKHRLVPLNPKSRKALDAYLIEREKVAAAIRIKTQALFFSVRNRYPGANQGSLNVRSVGRMLLNITKVRGLPPMHPHLLRHACATHMLDNGCPLDVISQILGHDNLDVTAHYAQVSTRLMMETYRSTHPHAKRAVHGGAANRSPNIAKDEP